MPDLPDDEVRLAALLVVRQLYAEPSIGDPMRERYNLSVLQDCRKVLFGKDSWKGKPRFRLVFRNEPDNEAVARVTVLSVAPRADLAAYKLAATRPVAVKRSGQARRRTN
jgi:hypothetical protein